jgi:hypothetical protein
VPARVSRSAPPPFADGSSATTTTASRAWATGPHAHVVPRTRHLGVWNDASSGCESPDGGGQPGSPTTCGSTPSTVHKVLTRYKCPRLKWIDPATGTRTKSIHKRSYVHDAPGDLVHVDIKRLGRIPTGGGWKKTGKVIGARNNKRERPGYAFIHHAVDDHSRLAYSEIHADEKKETATGFIQRARAFFAAHGITIKAMLTDNGACYRSRLWAKTLDAASIKHRRTRPYRPQTNGKVERFNRTLLDERAYAKT